MPPRDKDSHHGCNAPVGRVRTGTSAAIWRAMNSVVVCRRSDPFPGERCADAIRERVSLPYWIGNEQQAIELPLRLSIIPTNCENAAKLLQRAGTAIVSLRPHRFRPVTSFRPLKTARPDLAAATTIQSRARCASPPSPRGILQGRLNC